MVAATSSNTGTKIIDRRGRLDFRANSAGPERHECGPRKSLIAAKAHIDRIGLYAGHVPISVVAYGLPHLIDLCRHGWENVFAIRDLLLQQGWDRQPLLGTGAK
jgi:hypothetical protein